MDGIPQAMTAAELPKSQPGEASQRLPTAAETLDYLRDCTERSVLFWDTLRRRGDDMLKHARLGMPPPLDFRSETILDARRFTPHPANYALLRIVEAEGAAADESTARKAPVLVLDPRAGHGPGIGGFRRESEIGMALREGHPVYFAAFLPEPCAGQTLADVHHALRRFVATIAERHPGRPPILYGNCQAGWAAALLAADCEGVAGPVVMNGSPISYWAGEAGINPMRLLAAFTGGSWPAHLLSDLGGGVFDGAWLAQNFEALNPGRALWDKYAGLFTRVDAERDRFLAFERWWGGFHHLARDEIVAIVENLFIGNQLEQGVFRICEGCHADLRRLRSPLVVFASWGDNITPPHQALGWIPTVWPDTAALEAAGQRIVYLTNPRVGHLGIFVSATVAQHEHRAILASMEEIAALPPGLYQMTVEDVDGHEEQRVGFVRRKVEEIRFPFDRRSFERVRETSAVLAAAYETFVGPWVRACTTQWTAEALRWLHPMRAGRYGFSGAFNPGMRVVAAWADAVRAAGRHPLADDHPLLIEERAAMARVSSAFDAVRRWRDALAEQAAATWKERDAG